MALAGGCLLRPCACRARWHACERAGKLPRSCGRAQVRRQAAAAGGSSSSSSSSSSETRGGAARNPTPQQYLAPFSEVDVPAEHAHAAGGGSTDPWAQTLAVNSTLSSLYLPQIELPQHQQIDLAARRAKRTLSEIQAAGAKLGVPAEQVESGLQQLQVLVPGLTPSLDVMRASDWACVARDVERVASLVILLRSSFPRLDVGAVLARTPKLLLNSMEQLQQDVQQVKAMLAGLQDPDAVLQAVPCLLNPQELQRALSNLAAWFPDQSPLVMLANNPKLLLNIEEADLDADPTYGMPTIDPSREWPLL